MKTKKKKTIKNKLIENFKKEFGGFLRESFGLDPAREEAVKSFYEFCKNKLGFKTDVNIKFVNEREGGMTTGSFNTVTGEITVLNSFIYYNEF